jgi:hypothetical protein
VERELAGVKFKAIEEYCIDTRIYYEFREGFNYVCELRRVEDPAGKIRIVKKECDNLEKKGFAVMAGQCKEHLQLDELCVVCELTFDDDEKPLSENSEGLVRRP